MEQQAQKTKQSIAQLMFNPMSADTILQWDASSGVCRAIELQQVLAHGHLPAFRITGVPRPDHQTHCYWPGGEICLTPAFPSPLPGLPPMPTGIIFSITALLLDKSDHESTSQMTGKLVWFFSQQQTMPPTTSSVYPMLLGHASGAFSQQERITILPFLRACDPLQRHIDLVLRTAVAAQDRAEQLYVETLADALVNHFLQRYAASQPVRQQLTGGLIPYKLQRTRTYIKTHLTQKLSLRTLAAVAQMSPTHFAHLFKRTTGLAPHQYVILCRIEHAKWLLSETDMPLIDIGPESGFSDQSHFTALFRRHVSMTPKTYRDTTGRCAGKHTALSALQ